MVDTMEKQKQGDKLLTQVEYEAMWKSEHDIGNKKMTLRQWRAYYNRKYLKDKAGEIVNAIVNAAKDKKGQKKAAASINSLTKNLKAFTGGD